VVAVAVSTGPINTSALEWGFREATARKARLRVVHVVPEALAVAGAGFTAGITADLEMRLAPFQEQHPDVTVEVEVLLGEPVADLIEVSKTVDLLILGVHPEGTALTGSIRGVMAHAHCPVGLTREKSS
jgi:nucleotide-binding universal stress UspA family protein